MKKHLLLLIYLVFFACDSDTIDIQSAEETRSILNSESLELHLSEGIPIEGGFSILEQAEHFLVSEIQYREQGVFYAYTPKPGFAGTDVVKIKRSNSNGAEVYSETITTLTIQVRE